MPCSETKASSASELAATADLPTLDRLHCRLPKLLGLNAAEALDIVRRTPNAYTSTFPSEILECRLPTGKLLKLFCKYSFASIVEKDQRSVRPFYEIDVYRNLLSDLPPAVARMHGSWTGPDVGEGWLLLEYIEGARRLTHTVEHVAALEAAARWLGTFHRIMERRIGEQRLAFMRHLDASHYHAQLERIADGLGLKRSEYAWLGRLDRRFDRFVSIAREAPHTVVHAEFYPDNVLTQGERVVPVDWETTSIGPGDFDLAMLLEGWDRPTVQLCLRAYSEARGWDRDTRHAVRRLTLGTALVNLHWLSLGLHTPRAGRVVSDTDPQRFDQLRRAVRNLGVL